MVGILPGDLMVECLHGFVRHTPLLAEKEHQPLVFLVIAGCDEGGNGCIAAMLAEIGHRRWLIRDLAAAGEMAIEKPVAEDGIVLGLAPDRLGERLAAEN